MVSIIAAMTEERTIGSEGGLPWCLPADMAWFKKQTLGKPVLMGRKTFQSIGGPLYDRKNIVITGQTDYRAEGCTVVHDVNDALAAAGEAEELMVIGGADCYRQMLPLASRFYLTLVHGDLKGDAVFPDYDRANWVETFREEYSANDENPFDMTFLVLERG